MIGGLLAVAVMGLQGVGSAAEKTVEKKQPVQQSTVDCCLQDHMTGNMQNHQEIMQQCLDALKNPEVQNMMKEHMRMPEMQNMMKQMLQNDPQFYQMMKDLVNSVDVSQVSDKPDTSMNGMSGMSGHGHH